MTRDETEDIRGPGRVSRRAGAHPLSYTELEDRVKVAERELITLKARLEEIEGQHS